MKVGFIGLGHMGNPMAHNLIKQGNAVMVYDVVDAAVDAMVLKGAEKAGSLMQLAKECQVIFTMLQTGAQVRDVCTKKDGLFAHAIPNTLFIDCSTIDVPTARELHQLAENHHFTMVDAPVSGGVAGAESGSLTLMVGGTATAFLIAKPWLQSVGKKIIAVGPAGNGQVAKMCNNMLLGISMIGVSEAFTLGEKLGLEPAQLFEVSSQSSGQCWAMTSYCPVPGLVENVPSNREYQPGFAAAMMLKDLRLSQEAAKSVAFETPLGNAATELYETFVAESHGNMDFSGIITLLKE